MGVSFTFSQINRLLSRSPIDVLSFTRYFLLGAPSRLIDRFPGKARLAYVPGSKYDVGAKFYGIGQYFDYQNFTDPIKT